MRHYIDESEVWIPDRMVRVGKKKEEYEKTHANRLVVRVLERTGKSKARRVR